MSTFTYFHLPRKIPNKINRMLTTLNLECLQVDAVMHVYYILIYVLIYQMLFKTQYNKVSILQLA